VYGYEPDDVTDPWKVYRPPLAETLMWVNDLHALQFGQGYWISATQAITWEIKGSTTNVARQSTDLISPPATYYGQVLASATFAPTAGMPVHAYVEGQLCGQSQTLSVGGDIVYSVNVGYTPMGGMCGEPGQTVNFEVGGITMVTEALWRNDDIYKLVLSLAEDAYHYIYLPLTMRESQ